MKTIKEFYTQFEILINELEYTTSFQYIRLSSNNHNSNIDYPVVELEADHSITYQNNQEIATISFTILDKPASVDIKLIDIQTQMHQVARTIISRLEKYGIIKVGSVNYTAVVEDYADVTTGYRVQFQIMLTGNYECYE